MKNEIMNALLTLSNWHYNHTLADMAVSAMVPSELYCEDGKLYEGDFGTYLERMNVEYHTAKDMIERHVRTLPVDITDGDAYYALAMAYADYGLAIYGNKDIAYKIAFGWLTDPDK